MGKRGDVLRAEVLRALRSNDGPQSAYDILAAMRDFNPKTAPTTVYRALNSLTEQGLVHRLESMNAYVLCQCDHHTDEAILSICDDCGSVEETVAPELLKSVQQVIGKSGFAPSRHVVEVHGRCAGCAPASATP